MQRSILFFLVTMTFISSLKIPIINEDYVEILIGTPPQKKKLLIDPVAPFSYIQSEFSSVSYDTKHESYSFSNIFGDFKGEWAYDFLYITEDKYFPLKMKILKVNTTNTQFKIDGVLGLGYSQKIHPDCSIYANLAKLSGIFKTQNVLSYDKKKKLLTVGELPAPDNFNPVTFHIFEGKADYPATFVNLTSIKVVEKYTKNSTLVDVKGIAKLGLMPVIIAPKTIQKTIETEYHPLISLPKQTFKANKKSNEFYSSLVTDMKHVNVSAEMIFGKIAYKYDHTIEDGSRNISNIRFNTNDKIDFWYIGIDNLNVQRADFNFNNNTVTLFSPTAYDILGSKTYILFSFILFGVAVSIVVAVIVRTQCQKKRRHEITKEDAGQELI